MTIEEDLCPNCRSSVEGEYCTQCGQKQFESLTWAMVFKSVLDSLELKRGLLFTVWNLTVRPVKSLSEYLGGRTRPFMNPVSYLLFALGASFLSVQLERSITGKDLDPEMYSTIQWIVYSFCLVWPFILACIYAIAIIEKRPNYLHLLLTGFYLTGHLLIVMTLLKPLVNLLVRLDLMADWFSLIILLVLALWFTMMFLRAYRSISYFSLIWRLTGSFIFILICLILIRLPFWYFNVDLLPEMDKSLWYYMGYASAILVG